MCADSRLPSLRTADWENTAWLQQRPLLPVSLQLPLHLPFPPATLTTQKHSHTTLELLRNHILRITHQLYLSTCQKCHRGAGKSRLSLTAAARHPCSQRAPTSQMAFTGSQEIRIWEHAGVPGWDADPATKLFLGPGTAWISPSLYSQARKTCLGSANRMSRHEMSRVRKRWKKNVIVSLKYAHELIVNKRAAQKAMPCRHSF